jgi:ATP-binding cassette subfamily C protein CydD
MNVQGKAGEHVAWMPQQPSLLPGSVEFNIVGGEVLDRGAFDWAIDFAELGTIDRKLEIDDYGRGLSGGQAQRVSLARALYRLKTRNLEKLLLDEPTSSIDLETATRIWSKLSRLAKGGVMVIAVTHQENFAPLANRVVRFEA